jgi:outer membrane protein assembly factor BamB
MQFCPRAAHLAPLAFAFAGSAAGAATPAVTLSPIANHPQGTTEVSGTGFGAGEAVDIYFDTADELLVVTNGSGAFSAHAVDIPADAPPGTHWVTAIGRKDGAAAQRTFLVRTRWNSHGFNERGQRHNPYENVLDASNVAGLDLAWNVTTASIIFSSPAVAQITGTYNPYVFFGSGEGNLYAVDSTGAVVWKKPAGTGIASSPAVASTTVYVGSEDGRVYAFKAANGAAAWPSPATTGASIEASPTVANGIVYIGSEDGKLYAFHASDGTAAWPSPAVTGGIILYSTPAVAEGTVYVGSYDDKLYAFDAKTGTQAWTFTTGDKVVGSPAVAGGIVYFGSDDHKIYALNAKTGTQKWAVTAGNLVDSSPAVANGIVYITTYDDKLYALRASDGATLWTGALTGAGYSGPAVANGVVYVGTDGYDVEAFSAGGCGTASCTPLWTASTGGAVYGSPTISDGMLYFTSYDHNLYAYALNGGNNAAYKFRKPTQPPSYASLHPDMRLKPVPR